MEKNNLVENYTTYERERPKVNAEAIQLIRNITGKTVSC